MWMKQKKIWKKKNQKKADSKKLSSSKLPILNNFLLKFHWLVLGLVEMNVVKDIDVV